MLKAQSCPEGPLLQQFLLGQLPTDEIENWAQHVEQCGRCVEKLAGFQINDGLVETMAAAAVAREEPPAQILDGLVKRLSALWSRLTPHATEDGQPETPQESSSGSLTPEPCDFLAPAQQPGEIGRLGPYRVLQLLGSGGMGMVFQAEDPHLQRLVALKVMRPALAQRALARQRFLREARTAATFIHDHVVGIYQVGEDRGLPFLAMPLLPGESLEKRLKREGRLPVGTVLAIGRQVATALAAAHSRGLIHRDIKPANIWLETLPDGQGPLAPRERVKILDFGLARAIDSATHLTESGAFAGTPGYMAPEQVRGEPLDGRCDLFSLGCVLYRSCTGRLAFAGANPLATLRALELEQPQPPQLLNPEVPPDLSNLILRLLDKRAENRPLAAADLIQTLEGIERQLPVRPLPGPTALPASRRRFSLAARFLILAGGLLLVLGSLGYLVGPALLRMVVHRDDPVGETGQENGPNKGWKGFRPGGHFRTTGPNPHGLVAADLNGDGRLDLISPNLGSTTVSVLLGNGDGTFQDPISFETGTRPRNAVVADVNGDGKPDLVVVNGGDPEKRQKGSACILLGDGKGSFGKPVHIEVGFDPLGLVVIDLNGDGKLDVVIANQGVISRGIKGNLSVLLGKGDGTFQPALELETGSHFLHGLVAGDFNGDGKLDLVVSSPYDNTMSVLLGKGDGTFQSAVVYPTGGMFSSCLIVADLNRDGKLDLVVTHNTSTPTVSIFLGKGDGTFQKPISYEAGKKVDGGLAMDCNGDGKLDLLLCDRDTMCINLLLGNGDGTFQEPISLFSSKDIRGLVAADFNRDGALDLAVVDFVDSEVAVYFNQPPPPHDDVLDAAVLFNTGLYPAGGAVGDFNGDGKADLAVANRFANTVSILLGKGDGSFQAGVEYPTGLGSLQVAVADFNGDGKQDLAVANMSVTEDGLRGNVSVLLGNGNGTFRKAVHYPAGPHPNMVVVGDFDGDGKLDLAVADGFHWGAVSILLGKGDGTFQTAVLYYTGVHTGAIAVADLNRDGKLDLVLNSGTTHTICVLLGKEKGTFGTPVHYPVGRNPNFVAVADFNRDGKLDLAVSNPGDTMVSILLGNGDGTFRPGDNFSAGKSPAGVRVGDFNGDGFLDLVVQNGDSGGINVLLGNGDASFRPPRSYLVGPMPSGLLVGDFNGDGRPDVAVSLRPANKIAVMLNRIPE